ncbi:MAG: hypothetical protein LN413_00190 [Candidatus Thermoplasmatota archaeon]|nr:hypothetical protein [Candidatus Thermoplasmatota archaeon]
MPHRAKKKRRRNPSKNGDKHLKSKGTVLSSVQMVTSEAIHPIKVWLTENGKSVAWLHRQTKINRTRIHHFMSGYRSLPDADATKIAKALGKSKTYVMGKGDTFRRAIVKEPK